MSPKSLSLAEVVDLLAASPRTKDAILVGGQALNAWAVHYRLKKVTAAVSADIDFIGNKADAIAAGLAWHGQTRVAGLDDHTPNAATVVIQIEGESHTIDFLTSVLGIESEKLDKWAVKIDVGEHSFRVMHPLHVLVSALENTYGETLCRRDGAGGEYYRDRVAVASKVAAAMVMELLNSGKTRAALNAAEFIAALATCTAGVAAWRRDKLDLLASIPKHAAWPEEFTKTKLPQIREQVEKRRAPRTSAAMQHNPIS